MLLLLPENQRLLLNIIKKICIRDNILLKQSYNIEILIEKYCKMYIDEEETKILFELNKLIIEKIVQDLKNMDTRDQYFTNSKTDTIIVQDRFIDFSSIKFDNETVEEEILTPRKIFEQNKS